MNNILQFNTLFLYIHTKYLQKCNCRYINFSKYLRNLWDVSLGITRYYKTKNPISKDHITAKYNVVRYNNMKGI